MTSARPSAEKKELDTLFADHCFVQITTAGNGKIAAVDREDQFFILDWINKTKSEGIPQRYARLHGLPDGRVIIYEPIGVSKVYDPSTNSTKPIHPRLGFLRKHPIHSADGEIAVIGHVEGDKNTILFFNSNDLMRFSTLTVPFNIISACCYLPNNFIAIACFKSHLYLYQKVGDSYHFREDIPINGYATPDIKLLSANTIVLIDQTGKNVSTWKFSHNTLIKINEKGCLPLYSDLLTHPDNCNHFITSHLPTGTYNDTHIIFWDALNFEIIDEKIFHRLYGFLWLTPTQLALESHDQGGFKIYNNPTSTKLYESEVRDTLIDTINMPTVQVDIILSYLNYGLFGVDKKPELSTVREVAEKKKCLVM